MRATVEFSGGRKGDIDAAALRAVADRPRSEPPEAGDNSGAVNAGHLKAFIGRIERLEEDKKAIADDIKEVYAKAKGNGFDAKIIRKIVSMRRQDDGKRREEQSVLDLYLGALGMLSDTPLGQAAVSRAFGKGRP